MHVARRLIGRVRRLGKPRGRRAELRAASLGDGARDFANPRNFVPDRFAAGQRKFAVHQVDAMYAVRALVDRSDARIPHVLRGAGLFDEAHAAVNLHAERRRFVADVGREGLGDRRQQRGAIGAGRPLLLGESVACEVERFGGQVADSASRMNIRFIVISMRCTSAFSMIGAMPSPPFGPRPWRRSRAKASAC